MADDEKTPGQMTGPEHYAEAQLLLDRLPVLTQTLAERGATATQVAAGEQTMLMEAQVHATLALAAATARATSVQAYTNAAGPHAAEQAAEIENVWTKAGAW